MVTVAVKASPEMAWNAQKRKCLISRPGLLASNFDQKARYFDACPRLNVNPLISGFGCREFKGC
jgi:hypothetical protein